MSKTGKGAFRYCHLNKPDTKYNADGEFSVSAVFDAEAKSTKRMLAELNEIQAETMKEAVEAYKKMKPASKQKLKAKGITGPIAMPVCEIIEDDEGSPTGEIAIRFKTKAQFQSKRTGNTVKKVIPFYDGKGQAIEDKKRPLIYSGTVGAIDYTPRGTFIPSSCEVYVSCYLNSIRISKLVTAGSGAGGDWEEDEDSDFDGGDLEEYTPDEEAAPEGDDLAEGLDDDLDDAGEAEDGDDLDDEIPF